MNTEHPCAAPIRDATEIERMERVDTYLRRLAHDLGAHEMRYPALIAREVIERAEYPQAFPHLVMSTSVARDPLVEADQLLTAGNQEPTAWCLAPAVCYHVYSQLRGRRLSEPLVIASRGRCFRHESGTSHGVRQVEFEMREIVLVGGPSWIQATVETGRLKLELLARALGLAGSWQVAEDPFFLPRARNKAILQRLLEVKLEYQADTDGLALASVNRHGDFFSRRFGITGPQGEPLHTACLAVGLDRWCARMNGAQDGKEAMSCSECIS